MKIMFDAKEFKGACDLLDTVFGSHRIPDALRSVVTVGESNDGGFVVDIKPAAVLDTFNMYAGVVSEILGKLSHLEESIAKYESSDSYSPSKKYELVKDSFINWDGKKLYRIRALKDFGFIHSGKLGGFVESEENLSQEGDCWVGDDAKVYDNAKVCDDALACGDARVRVAAVVSGSATVCGRADVYGSARISERATVKDRASIGDKATVSGDAIVRGNASMIDCAKVYGDAEISGNAGLFEWCSVYGNATVSGKAGVWGSAKVCGDAKIAGNDNVSELSFIDDEPIEIQEDSEATPILSECGEEILLKDMIITSYPFGDCVKSDSNTLVR